MREKAKRFLYEISQKKLTIPSAAMILGSTYLLSNILGVFRERLIAANFGASHLTDIFYASFKIPDLIFNLLVLGAISSAFIPVYIDYLSKEKQEEANRVASNLMNFLMLATLVFALIVFVLARKLVPLLLPGFFTNGPQTDFNTFQVAVNAVRIMLISPIFFAISSVFGGILNSHKKFISYSLAPVIYNISIIIGIVYFSPLTNPPVYGLLFGVIIGAFFHAAIQLPSVIKNGFRWKPILNYQKHELPKIFKLMVPRALSIGVGQINILIDTIIASYFIGGITVLNFANDIQTLPTVVFAISISTAVFPLLAEHYSKKNYADFLKSFSESTRKILYFMIPASIGLIVLRAQVVRLIFGTGHFSWEDTYWTTKALGFFAAGLVAQGVIPILLRAFYALKDTKTPLLVSIASVIINLIFSVTLPFIPGLGLEVAGLALAFSIAGFVNAGLLFYFLHEKIGALDKDNKIFASTARLVVASVFMGVAAHYSLYLFEPLVNNTKVIGLALQTAGAVAVGAIVYFTLTKIWKVEESGYIFKKAS